MKLVTPTLLFTLNLFLFLPAHTVSEQEKLNKLSQELIIAAKHNHQERTQELLAIPGIDVNARTIVGATALILASINGHPHIVNLLLQSPIQIDAYHPLGYTALMEASYYGHTEIVQALLHAHADMNLLCTDSQFLGYTALHLAVHHNHLSTVQALIHAHASVHICNTAGDSVLMIAAAKGNQDIVRLLIEEGGADPAQRNRLNNQSAQDYAQLGNFNELGQLLEEYTVGSVLIKSAHKLSIQLR